MDEMVTYATPMDVLRQVLHLHENDSRDITTLRVESAIEAIKLYHKQFDNPQHVPTPPPPVLTLEEKVLKLKECGVIFEVAEVDTAYIPRPNFIMIGERTTTELFEKEVDEKLKYFNDRSFIEVLKKNNLIHY